ncbi:hypothetical protein H6G41_19290 [Tolypothrix sp. FACHB-123]|uniref:hypothetical protein n=1 Tax=Tolypothrix sp. FACHB-123 TaxID=2692868 RepID=UPI001681D637|nr:hypothetical protein [Tolypothrix sp. FACHB-123]MBD2356745.1 hypothetical protein [Tolypothrix sp. FACHB-123]
MDSFSLLPDFIRSSNNIKTVLKIGEQPPEPLPRLKAQERGSPEIFAKPKQFVTELLPVFSHMSFLLIETLAETQHGELIISSKKAKYETIVELSGHISHRYKLTPQELQEIQQLHHYIIESWIAWRQSHKGK